MGLLFAFLGLYGIGLLVLWFFALLLLRLSASELWHALVRGSAFAVGLTPVFRSSPNAHFAGPFLWVATEGVLTTEPGVMDLAARWLVLGLPVWWALAWLFGRRMRSLAARSG